MKRISLTFGVLMLGATPLASAQDLLCTWGAAEPFAVQMRFSPLTEGAWEVLGRLTNTMQPPPTCINGQCFKAEEDSLITGVIDPEPILKAGQGTPYYYGYVTVNNRPAKLQIYLANGGANSSIQFENGQTATLTDFQGCQELATATRR